MLGEGPEIITFVWLRVVDYNDDNDDNNNSETKKNNHTFRRIQHNQFRLGIRVASGNQLENARANAQVNL